ncbi:hypothetical protein [Micromonospora sp. 067-2]|uniref:hypothetical protein n=1 Tax=Micromonospora sp. 067-2 TaxID=2789270 RepID=UPI00397A9605
MTIGRSRFAPLLDQVSDLRSATITADAMHCKRKHVTHLTQRSEESARCSSPAHSLQNF